MSPLRQRHRINLRLPDDFYLALPPTIQQDEDLPLLAQTTPDPHLVDLLEDEAPEGHYLNVVAARFYKEFNEGWQLIG